MENPADKISLGALIDGFSKYAKTVRGFLLHPVKFPKTLDISGENAFHDAFGLVLYAIAVSFFLLVPIFAKYTVEVSKTTFLIRFLTQFAMYCLLLHLGLRLIGRTKSDLRCTAVVYSNIGAVGLPSAVIALYPILLVAGPTAIWGTAQDTIRLEHYLQDHPALLIYSQCANLLLTVWLSIITISWFSFSHRLSKRRAALSLFVSGAVGAAIQNFVLNPVFLVAFGWLDQWLKYS